MRFNSRQGHRPEFLLHLLSRNVSGAQLLMTIRSIAIIAALFAVLTAGAFAQSSMSIVYKYSTLNFPGAPTFNNSTSANAINNNNVVVGSYNDTANHMHGYIYSGGTYTAVNYPGAAATAALGINDNNDIVGLYLLPNASATHGFLRHNGVFTTIDFPNSTSTAATGINNAGSLVGSYFGNSPGEHGFLLKNGTFTTIDAPLLNPGDLPDTELNGINNQGWITGQVFTGDFWRGFWIVGSDFDFLEPPFSLDNTVTSSNGHGDVVGEDAGLGFISFSVESSEGSESTERFPVRIRLNECPSGINFARVIVGPCRQGSGQAFLGVPALTLNVTSPVNHSTDTNPVHVAANASGLNPVSQMQVWVNGKEIFHVSGGTLNTNITLPVGANERFVVQAVDSKGVTTKVVETITVH